MQLRLQKRRQNPLRWKNSQRLNMLQRIDDYSSKSLCHALRRRISLGKKQRHYRQRLPRPRKPSALRNKTNPKVNGQLRGGFQAWSKEQGLGPCGVGLRGFKSHPPHQRLRIDGAKDRLLPCYRCFSYFTDCGLMIR